ncbi:alpha/beta hydrolase [Nocardia nova]|uniref:alpha/beta hydrolase n=1 Tax=Nocardia nova TaxID=37330 RepID=UPI00378D5EE6
MTPPAGRATRAELDREYSPSSCAPGYRDTLSACARSSAAALAELPSRRDLRYGPHPAETLHLFPVDRATAPLLVFVHGGHWQESSKDDSCFPAPDLIAAGIAFAALGYGLAPARRIGEMVDAVRSGLDWIRAHAEELGIDPGRIVLSGSSAGAHLVAAALTGAADGQPPVAGACLLSGVYDLEPVRHSYVNDAVRLTAREAHAHSPVHHLPLRAAAIVLARGQHETREYARQQRMFAAALHRAGQRCDELVVAGRDHFDLPLDLGRAATPMGAAVRRMLGEPATRVGDVP